MLIVPSVYKPIPMKKFIKILMYFVLFPVLAFAGLVLTAVITDYDPEEITLVFESGNAQKLIDTLEFDICDSINDIGVTSNESR